MFRYEEPSEEDQWPYYFNRAEEILKGAEARKGRKPINKPSRSQLIFQHKNAQTQVRGGRREGVKLGISFNITHNGHPPCTVPFATLEKRFLDHLRLEMAHRGSYLILRAVVNPIKYVSMTTVAEGESGEVELVQVYNQDYRRSPASIMPEGQVFIVKEPYFKETTGGGTGVRVDHISDIIFLDGEDERIPEKWRPRIR